MDGETLREATPDRPVRVGRYDVTGTLGQGGMGTVHDAIEREHGERVALKTLSHLDPASLMRFKSEFRSVADLAHPNLVPVHELSCHEDLWFFTMDRLDGVDFLTWLRGAARSQAGAAAPSAPTVKVRGAGPAPVAVDEPASPSPPPSISRLRDALAQLVRGVHALHEAGLLHLDLKPSNVMVTHDGRVVVLDFGLVRAIGERAPWTSSGGLEGSISGTPAWMAPEQFLRDRVGEAADWYAVGLMLYQALTGVPACPLGDPTAIAYARNYLPVTPPHELVRGIPEDLGALAVALLAADPDARPEGAALVELTSGDPDRRREAVRATGALIGREAEQAWLGAALAEAAAGRAAIVHVTGTSGVGKSALVAALGEDARNRGALVLRGRCYERESVPYNAFDGLIDELTARLAVAPPDEVEADLPARIVELARVFPGLATVPAIAARLDAAPATVVPVLELRRRAMLGLRELIGKLATRRTVILALDDLQWADADSAALLDQLIAAPMAGGLVIAATYRPEEVAENPPVARHLADARAEAGRSDRRCLELALAPLGRAAAERLAAAAGAPPELAAEIAAEAGGVPFYVEELARFAHASDRPERSLDAVLARRVAALPDRERALVEALAVASAPVPVGAAFVAAELGGALRALWNLRGASLVRATGARATDRVELQHDRVREVVLAGLAPERTAALHLALGRALLAHDREAWLFEAVSHLNAVPALVDDRRALAVLDLEAGRRARRAAAFPLAFACLDAGARLLGPTAWDDDYDLALALHGEAAEAAFLAHRWEALDAHVAQVKARARSMLDQLIAVEAEIDAHMARAGYAAAIDSALVALHGLDADTPGDPDADAVGAAVGSAMASLAKVGPAGVAALPAADDPAVIAAMRIQARICSAAYFARPLLLPMLACKMIDASVARGLTPATAYAVAIHGIVLNSLGQHADAHAWGEVALGLLDRFPDRSLEVRTRHVVHDLVGVWMVPLRSTLPNMRRVVTLGAETGDFEYAAYAAHAVVHNGLYASMPLDDLVRDCEEMGAFIRTHQQDNALHVHLPYERWIACLTGAAPDPARLDGDGYVEAEALAAARASGSRSGQGLLPTVMGLARFHAGAIADAHACFHQARQFLDGMPSTWHLPMLHQHAALAIYLSPPDVRASHAADAEASLAAIRAFATASPVNFAHRVSLIEASRAAADGDVPAALTALAAAIAGATAGDWLADLAIAHELAAQIDPDPVSGRAHRRAARAAYEAWGALACAARLA